MRHYTSCLHCLTPDAAVLRVDRKGRPFTYCPHCVTRSFIPTAAGLRGIRLVAPGLVELHQRMLSRLSEEDARGTELMRQLQRERLAVVQGG